jgi:hypothetical protein
VNVRLVDLLGHTTNCALVIQATPTRGGGSGGR